MWVLSGSADPGAETTLSFVVTLDPALPDATDDTAAATLGVVPISIFADGFESGDTSAWSLSVP